MGLPTELLADRRYPVYAARLEEANCRRVKVSRVGQNVRSICTIFDIIDVPSEQVRQMENTRKWSRTGRHHDPPKLWVAPRS